MKISNFVKLKFEFFIIDFEIYLKKFAFKHIILIERIDDMTAAKKIKMMLITREMTMAQLAAALNKSPSTLSYKNTRDNFSEKDLKEIADILDFDYDIVFTDRKTGKKI